MPAKKVNGATAANSRSSRKQSKTVTSTASSRAKQRSTAKRNASGVGATLKRAGQTVAEVMTDAVDSIAQATGLKNKKRAVKAKA